MSALEMSYAQRVRYAEDNIVRVTHSQMDEIWAPEVIDLDGIMLAVMRCPVGGDEHCTQGCDGDDCRCSCEYTSLLKCLSTLKAGSWERCRATAAGRRFTSWKSLAPGRM
jgi:hypothetical protein